MSKKYELRAHSRDVSIGDEKYGDIGHHTGYDLITTNEDGSKTIQYIDLRINFTFDIFFYISTPTPAQEYMVTYGNTCETLLWGTQTAHNGKMIVTTEEYLNNNQVYATVVESNSEKALAAFNKIKMEASILTSLKDYLTYNLVSRNCNTSTKYFAEQYLGGKNVFSDLAKQTGGVYVGSNNNFYNPNSTDITDITIKSVREILDKYYSLVGSNVDLTDVNYGVVNQSNGWYAKFSTDDYNYVFAGNGTPNIVDISGNSRIYSTSGNSVINAGDGVIHTANDNSKNLLKISA